MAPGGHPRLVSTGHTTSDDLAYNNTGFQLALDGSSSGATSGFFDVGASGGPWTVSWSLAEPLAPGEWHQYAGVYDGLHITAYIDGVAVGTAEANGADIRAGSTNIGIGYNPGDERDHFTGQLADVVISSDPLSAADISSIYEQVSANAATG